MATNAESNRQSTGKLYEVGSIPMQGDLNSRGTLDKGNIVEMVRATQADSIAWEERFGAGTAELAAIKIHENRATQLGSALALLAEKMHKHLGHGTDVSACALPPCAEVRVILEKDVKLSEAAATTLGVSSRVLVKRGSEGGLLQFRPKIAD